MDDELARVGDAISALAARGVGPAADAVLTARLEAVHRAVRRLQAVELALVREVDRAGLATRAGAPAQPSRYRRRSGGALPALHRVDE